MMETRVYYINLNPSINLKKDLLLKNKKYKSFSFSKSLLLMIILSVVRDHYIILDIVPHLNFLSSLNCPGDLLLHVLAKIEGISA